MNQQINEQFLIDHFMDYDVTNLGEMIAASTLIVLISYLLQQILMNILKITKWKQHNHQVSVIKLLTINYLLLTQVSIKLYSLYYALLGASLSDFSEFDSKQPSTIYMNWNCYVGAQTTTLLLQNIIMTIASYYWYQILRMKYAADGKLNIFTVFIGLLLLATFLFNLSALVAEFIILDSSYMQTFLGVGTLASSSIFIFFCIYLYCDLDTFYQVDRQYKQKFKRYACYLVLTQLIKSLFNFLPILIAKQLKTFKSGRESDYMIPDTKIYWAIFVFLYGVVTDFIPVSLIGRLFSPTHKLQQGSLLKIDDSWDVASIG